MQVQEAARQPPQGQRGEQWNSCDCLARLGVVHPVENDLRRPVPPGHHVACHLGVGAAGQTKVQDLRRERWGRGGESKRQIITHLAAEEPSRWVTTLGSGVKNSLSRRAITVEKRREDGRQAGRRGHDREAAIKCGGNRG